MRSGTRRREVLAALCGATGFAGCATRRSGPDRTSTGTVTPAPVPTTRPTRSPAATPRGGRCPELPTNAEVYLCSPAKRGDGGLRMVPEPGTGTAAPGAGGTAFVLSNGTSLTFRTGRDWWTLAGRGRDGWTTLDQGDGADRMAVDPGETFAWTLGGGGGGPDTERIDVGVRTGGPYALSITGYVAAGELTAVVAPFRVGSGTG